MPALALTRRHAFVALALLLAVIAVAVSPQLLRSQVQRAFVDLGDADPFWLWVAAGGFAASLLTSALAWRAAIGYCGGCLSAGEAAARFAVGSLVNSFSPARLGDAVRIALFSRALDDRDRVWTTGGVFAAVGAARALTLGMLVVAASALGAMPLWPVVALGSIVAAAITVSSLARRRSPRSHLSHLLDAFRALGRSPRRACVLVGLIGLSTAARFGAAAASAAALGVRSPLLAALLIVPAIDLAGVLPLTPGNVGLTSGAIAIALQSRGVDLSTAISTGIALHAVETAVGISFGLAGFLQLTHFPSPLVRRLAMATAGTGACLILAAGVGVMVFDLM